MNKNFKNAIGCIIRHGKILWRGFVRMLYGAATAGLIALAVYGFIMIPMEGGYIAVCEFLGSIATVCVAMTSMYSLGCGKKKKGGYER